MGNFHSITSNSIVEIGIINRDLNQPDHEVECLRTRKLIRDEAKKETSEL